MATLDWRAAIDGFSRVMKLVHLAARYDMVDEGQIAAQLQVKGRIAYESELMIQAQRAGCPGRSAHLTNPAILAQLGEIYTAHAKSIVNTYNYDLATQIKVVRMAVPRANRFTYAKRIRDWDGARAQLKNPVISGVTDGVARSLAQEHFHAKNDTEGYAILKPIPAVCPVCQGWVARGKVPLDEALAHPPPYHPRCPHLWEIHTDKNRTPEECQLLWMGE